MEIQYTLLFAISFDVHGYFFNNSMNIVLLFSVIFYFFSLFHVVALRLEMLSKKLAHFKHKAKKQGLFLFCFFLIQIKIRSTILVFVIKISGMLFVMDTCWSLTNWKLRH